MFWMAGPSTAATRLHGSLALACEADARAAVVCKGGKWMSLSLRPRARLVAPMLSVPLSPRRSGLPLANVGR